MNFIQEHLLDSVLGDVLAGRYEAALRGVGYDWGLAGLALGLVYLLLGAKVFRVLLTVHLVLLGAVLGLALGGKVFLALSGGLLVGGLAGFITWRRTELVATILTGLYAAVLALGIVLTHKLITGQYALPLSLAAAAAVGVGVAALTRYAYQPMVIAFTSLHGAAGVLGGCAGILLAYSGTHGFAHQWVNREPLLLPVSLLILSAGGCFYQWRFAKGGRGESSASQPKTESKRPAQARRRAA